MTPHLRSPSPGDRPGHALVTRYAVSCRHTSPPLPEYVDMPARTTSTHFICFRYEVKFISLQYRLSLFVETSHNIQAFLTIMQYVQCAICVWPCPAVMYGTGVVTIVTVVTGGCVRCQVSPLCHYPHYHYHQCAAPSATAQQSRVMSCYYRVFCK